MTRFFFNLFPAFAAANFVVLIAIMGTVTPDYDPLAQFISELGAKGAPYAVSMNWFGILPFGLGVTVFGIGHDRGQYAPVSMRIGGTLIAISGLGFALAGLFSCDKGCGFTDLSLSAQIHNYAAFGAFVLLPPTTLLVAITRFRQRGNLVTLAFETGIVVVLSLGLGLLFVLGPTHAFTGAAQRLFIFALATWIFAMSLLPLITIRQPSNDKQP
jgi:hypothetical membrane protein